LKPENIKGANKDAKGYVGRSSGYFQNYRNKGNAACARRRKDSKIKKKAFNSHGL